MNVRDAKICLVCDEIYVGDDCPRCGGNGWYIAQWIQPSQPGNKNQKPKGMHHEGHEETQRPGFRSTSVSRTISNIVVCLLVFVWTIWLRPEAQVGPLEGTEKITLSRAVTFGRFYIQGKTKQSKYDYFIPYSSVLFIRKGR